MGLAGRLRPRRLAEEAKESRPMESEHTVVEINRIKPLRIFGSLMTRMLFNSARNLKFV